MKRLRNLEKYLKPMKCFLMKRSVKSMIFMDSMGLNSLLALLLSIITRMLTTCLKVFSVPMDSTMPQTAASSMLISKHSEVAVAVELGQPIINILRLLQMAHLRTPHILANLLPLANTLLIHQTQPQTISPNTQAQAIIMLHHLLIQLPQLSKRQNNFHPKGKPLKKFTMSLESLRILNII